LVPDLGKRKGRAELLEIKTAVHSQEVDQPEQGEPLGIASGPLFGQPISRIDEKLSELAEPLLQLAQVLALLIPHTRATYETVPDGAGGMMRSVMWNPLP
jgi:hypothetical protein